jgi:hypothetical protein
MIRRRGRARSAYVGLKASFAREIARLSDALAEMEAKNALGERA